MPSSLIRLPFQYWLAALVTLLAGIHLLNGHLRLADPDEFQFLTNAADAARGLMPYRDFWDNHGPLNIWLLQPVFEIWQGGHSLIIWLRGAMWVNTALICTLTFWLYRRLYPGQKVGPWFCLVFLLSTPPFLSKGLEIRGDNPANLLSLCALATMAIGVSERRYWLFFFSGLAVGVMTWLTLKAVIAGAFTGVFFITWHLKSRQRPAFSGLLLALSGGLLPIITLVTIIAVLEIWEPFTLCYLGSNSSRAFAGFSSSDLTEIVKKSPVWGIAAIMLLVSLIPRVVGRRTPPLESALSAYVLSYLGQYIFLMPTKNLQSLLPAFAPFAILAGLTVEGLLKRYSYLGVRRRYSAGIIGVSLATGLVLGLWYYADVPNHELAQQVEFADRALEASSGKKFIFDPSGIVFLKPKPGQFHVLVTYIRDLHRAKVIDLDIQKLMIAGNIKDVVFDKRTSELRASELAFLKSHFVPTDKGPNCLLLQDKNALTQIPRSDLSGPELTWWEKGRPHKSNVPYEGKTDWYNRYIKLYQPNPT